MAVTLLVKNFQRNKYSPTIVTMNDEIGRGDILEGKVLQDLLINFVLKINA